MTPFSFLQQFLIPKISSFAKETVAAEEVMRYKFLRKITLEKTSLALTSYSAEPWFSCHFAQLQESSSHRFKEMEFHFMFIVYSPMLCILVAGNFNRGLLPYQIIIAGGNSIAFFQCSFRTVRLWWGRIRRRNVRSSLLLSAKVPTLESNSIKSNVSKSLASLKILIQDFAPLRLKMTKVAVDKKKVLLGGWRQVYLEQFYHNVWHEHKCRHCLQAHCVRRLRQKQVKFHDAPWRILLYPGSVSKPEQVRQCGRYRNRQKIRPDHKIQQVDRREQRTDKLDWRVLKEYCDKPEDGQTQLKWSESYEIGLTAANSSDKHQEKKLDLKYHDQKHKGGVDLKRQKDKGGVDGKRHEEHRARLRCLEYYCQLQENQTKPAFYGRNLEGHTRRTHEGFQEDGPIFSKGVEKHHQTFFTSFDIRGETEMTYVHGQSEILTADQMLKGHINLKLTCQQLKGHINLKLTCLQLKGHTKGNISLIHSCRQLAARVYLMYIGQTVIEKTHLPSTCQQQIGQDAARQVDGKTDRTRKASLSSDGNVQDQENTMDAAFTLVSVPLSCNEGGGLFSRRSAKLGPLGDIIGKSCVGISGSVRKNQRTLNVSDRYIDDRQSDDAKGDSAGSWAGRGHERDPIPYPKACCKRESTTARTWGTRRLNSAPRCIYSGTPSCSDLTASSVLIWSLCSLLLCVPLAASQSQTVVVGVFIPQKESPGAVEVYNRTLDVMFEKLSKRMPKFAFERKVVFEVCNAWDGMASFINLYKDDPPANIFVGPACDEVCMSVGPLTTRWKTPVFTYKCRSFVGDPDPGSRSDLVRSAASFQHMSVVVSKLFQEYGWDHFVIVSENGSESQWMWKMDALTHAMDGISVQSFRWTVNLKDVARVIEEIKYHMLSSFVFVLCMYPEDVIDFHEIMWQNGFFLEGLALLTFDFANYGWVQGASEAQIKAMTGLVDITVNTLEQEADYATFVSEITTASRAFTTSCRYKEIGTTVAEFADAILLMGQCIELSDKVASGDLCNIDLLRSKTFKGAAGDVTLDRHGMRTGNIIVNNLVEGCYRLAATAAVTEGTGTEKWQLSFQKMESIIWPGNTTHPPPFPSTCGWFKFPHCHEELANTLLANILLGLVACLVLIGCCLLLFFIFRRVFTERVLGSKDWIIPYSKLYTAGKFDGKSWRITGAFGSWANKSSSARPAGHQTPSQESLRAIATGRTFTKVTLYNNQLVSIKTVAKDTIVVTNDITKEFNQIRILKHSNVNQLIGACVEVGNVSLVSLYCQKGSLQDVLVSGSIKLDVVFQLSFLWDIASGMAYIHESPVGRHGRLKSSNVLIDSNWSCKVTDIAMPYFREGETSNPNKNLHDLLWMAPELLHDVALQRRGGTKKGDVYAFGIVMQEIVLRSQPYGIDPDDNPREIIQRVRKMERPPYRPAVPRSAADENVLDLMQMCWDDIDLFRPSFAVICDIIKNLRSEFGSANLVDQMLHMLSKYADNLEELVEQRTTQLEEEQQKTEELLCRMLPKSVAHDLKVGNEVMPESFSAVTIYFSDIVGFTSLAASSTPMQVVNLLNDLYTCFDNIIDTFDVYKVETIGDAYMVVSGLPMRNGDLHAAEIANMSLQLLSSVVTFRIRHRPEKKLQIRIGIHSGPVVAGVVGLKMPRYCLFGDTVNYASRMESTGIALHIHVSPECKRYLDKLGGFVLKERGPTEMKGKGVITTYFLMGTSSSV